MKVVGGHDALEDGEMEGRGEEREDAMTLARDRSLLVCLAISVANKVVHGER